MVLKRVGSRGSMICSGFKSTGSMITNFQSIGGTLFIGTIFIFIQSNTQLLYSYEIKQQQIKCVSKVNENFIFACSRKLINNSIARFKVIQITKVKEFLLQKIMCATKAL